MSLVYVTIAAMRLLHTKGVQPMADMPVRRAPLYCRSRKALVITPARMPQMFAS